MQVGGTSGLMDTPGASRRNQEEGDSYAPSRNAHEPHVLIVSPNERRWSTDAETAPDRRDAGGW